MTPDVSPKLWYLKLNRLFRSLSDEDLHRWVDRITVAMDYPRHCVIYIAEEPGDHVYLLKRGRVRLYRACARSLRVAPVGSVMPLTDARREGCIAGRAGSGVAHEATRPQRVNDRKKD